MTRSAQARAVTEALKKATQGHFKLNLNELRLVVAIERAVARLEAQTKLNEWIHKKKASLQNSLGNSA